MQPAAQPPVLQAAATSRQQLQAGLYNKPLNRQVVLLLL
jgi:hypothetical protein